MSEISKAWKEYQPQASQDGVSQAVQDAVSLTQEARNGLELVDALNPLKFQAHIR